MMVEMNNTEIAISQMKYYRGIYMQKILWLERAIEILEKEK